MIELAVLSVLALLAGVINSVAGGGALLTFPFLLSIGVPATTANATISVGIFGGQVSSAIGYRKYLKHVGKRFIPLGILGVLGGVAGAVLLDRTSDSLFRDVAPWFVLFGALLLAFQAKVKSLAGRYFKQSGAHRGGKHVLLGLVFLTVSLYGGYFGAGMGILFFALLSLSGIFTNIHTINGVKNLITIAINLSANLYFVFAGMVAWKYALIVFVGSGIGGYIGARSASRAPQSLIRWVVAAAGLVVFVALSVQ